MFTWGYTVGAGSGFMGGTRAARGTWDGGAATLDSIHVHFHSISGNVRPALYHSTTNDPLNADLIHDFGEVTPNGAAEAWSDWSASGSPSIPSGGYLFLAIKLGSCEINRAASPQQDIDQRYTMGNESSSVTDAWDDPCTDDTFNGTEALSIYITCTEASAIPGEIVTVYLNDIV